MTDAKDYVLVCKICGPIQPTQEQFERKDWHCPVCKTKIAEGPVWKGTNLGGR